GAVGSAAVMRRPRVLSSPRAEAREPAWGGGREGRKNPAAPAPRELPMHKVAVASWSELADRVPAYALVGNVDLVVIRYGANVSVLYGRCLHRGALLADGTGQGDNLICGVHDWDYRIETGSSENNNAEALQKFATWIEGGEVLVDADEIAAWERAHPQPFQRDQYQGLYADIHGDEAEPHVQLIQKYASEGLSK